MHPLEQSEGGAKGKPGPRNALGKREGGEGTDLADDSPDVLVAAAWP